MWPSTSRPDAYKLDKTQKIAILMTDGEYNSVHCKGVIAQDSTYGSGSISEQINCNATNGDAYKQSLAVCDAMKTAGVTVYTVAFQVYDSQNAKDLLAKCATRLHQVLRRPKRRRAEAGVSRHRAQDFDDLPLSLIVPEPIHAFERR